MGKKTHSESLTHFSYNQKSLRIRRKKSGLLYNRRDIKTQFKKIAGPTKILFLEDFLITKIYHHHLYLLGFSVGQSKIWCSTRAPRFLPYHTQHPTTHVETVQPGTGHGSWGPTHWLTCWEKKKNDLRFSQICLLGEHEPRTNFNSVYFFLLKFTSWVFCLPLFAQPLWSFWFFQRFWDDWRKILDDQAQSLGHQKIDRIHEFSMVFRRRTVDEDILVRSALVLDHPDQGPKP